MSEPPRLLPEGPRLAHAARLCALAGTELVRGRCRALTSRTGLTPNAQCLGGRFPVTRNKMSKNNFLFDQPRHIFTIIW